MTAQLAPRFVTRLPLRDKAFLAGEVVRTFVQVRRELRQGDLRSALAELRGSPPPSEPETWEPAELGNWLRLGRAVRRSLALLPGDTRCLTQSLVLLRLLSRRGTGGTLVIAVRPGEEFGAHAWVEVAGRPLLPRGAPGFERLVEL